MQEIAVQFVKYNINDILYLFKPITAVRGRCIEEGIFETESGVELYPIEEADPYFDNYFMGLSTIEELKNIDNNLDDSELISRYYLNWEDNCYLGIDVGEEIKILMLPISELFKSVTGQIRVSTNNNETNKIPMMYTEELLNYLKNLNSIDEVKKTIDLILEQSKNLTGERPVSQIEQQTQSMSKFDIKKDESKNLKLKELKDYVLENIIGQDEAVKTVTTTIMINQNSKNPRHKSHILIAGPSGTGKTEMINLITKKLDIPFFKADATAYTKEGYVGKSVTSMLLGLLEAANGDLKKAQNGILVIDEIDKKSSQDKEDVAGQAVLNSLLKMMDRDIIEVESGMFETINFDTSNLTIICMGAFSDLYEKKQKKGSKIGFNQEKKEDKDNNIIELTEQDFIDYGMTSEFMGRIGIIAYTKELSMDNLIKILKESKISPLKIEEEFFNDLGVKLTYTSEYLNKIAEKSQKLKLGARSLKKAIKYSLEEIYDQVLLHDNIEEIQLIEETVDNPKEYKKILHK